MTSIITTVLIGLSAIAVLLFIYFTYLFFRLRMNRLYLACMTLSLGAVVYISCNIALYASRDVASYLSIVQVQMYGTYLYHMGLLWFALLVSGTSLRFLYPAAAYIALFLVARQVEPGIIYSAVRGISTHNLPWGESLSILDADSGFWVYLYEAGYLYVYVAVLACAVKAARSAYTSKGKWFLAGSVALFLIALYDIAVFNFNLQWPFLGEAGFIAMIVMLGFVVSNDVLRSGMLASKVAESERKLKAIFDSTYQSIAIIGAEGTVHDVNDAWVSFTGKPKEQIIGEKIFRNSFIDLVDNNWPQVERAFRRAAGNEFSRGVIRLRDSRGVVRYIDYDFKPVLGDSGEVEMVILEGRDVSDIKKAEEKMLLNAQELAAANEELSAANEELESTNEFIEAQNRQLLDTQKSLVESETYNRILFSESYVPIIVIDPRSGAVTDCNNAAVRIFGYESRDALIGKTTLDVSAEMQPGGITRERASRERVNEALEKGNIIFEWTLRRPSGESWDAAVHLMTFRDKGRRMMQLTLEDITRKKATEKALRDSEERFRISAERIGILFYDYDIATGGIIWSGAVEKITGFSNEELREGGVSRWESLVHEKDRQWVMERLGRSIDKVSAFDAEYRFMRKEGMYVVVEEHGVVLPGPDGKAARMIGLMSDITEKKSAQEERDRIQAQLIQAQKMEAIGNLASGLAHDFNNMLAGIMGSLSLLGMMLGKENLSQPAAVAEYMKTATDSSRRAADMVRHLLTISQKREMQTSVVDVANSLRNIQNICKNSFPKSIALDFRLPGGPFLTMADPVQLEQVFLNLCVNASHAMTIMRPSWQKEGGTLSVSVSPLIADDAFVRANPSAKKESKYIAVTVKDTGVGMDQETQKRIFEPFFTTKPGDAGSGLGLSMVYGIVQQHGGCISLASEPGEGSAFTVFLSAHDDASAGGTAGSADGRVSRGHGKILVVDDEEAVLKVAGGILSTIGYEVVSSMRGDDAVALYREQGGGIAAVLLDMSMPGMSGIDILKELVAINPDVRVLLSSGFAEDDKVRAARDLGIRGFIHKPYTAGELSRAMKKIVGG